MSGNIMAAAPERNT